MSLQELTKEQVKIDWWRVWIKVANFSKPGNLQSKYIFTVKEQTREILILVTRRRVFRNLSYLLICWFLPLNIDYWKLNIDYSFLIYHSHYSCSLPFTTLLFFHSSFNFSNSCTSFSEKDWFAMDERSGWPAFTQAVNQKEATANMDCLIRLSTIPFNILL